MEGRKPFRLGAQDGLWVERKLYQLWEEELGPA